MQLTRESEDRFGPVQSLLKYAVLFSALSYALGYQIESNQAVILRIPWAVDAADTPQLLYRGFYSLLAVGFGVFLSVGFRELPIRVFRRNISATVVWLAPGVSTFAFTVPWLDIPDNIYNIPGLVLFYVAAAYLFFAALDPKDKESKAAHRAAYCLLAVYFLLCYLLRLRACNTGNLRGSKCTAITRAGCFGSGSSRPAGQTGKAMFGFRAGQLGGRNTRQVLGHPSQSNNLEHPKRQSSRHTRETGFLAR
jgi:hypothetical protein